MKLQCNTDLLRLGVAHTHMDELWVLHIHELCHTHKSVSHMFATHLLTLSTAHTYMDELWVQYINEMNPAHEWVMSHAQTDFNKLVLRTYTRLVCACYMAHSCAGFISFICWTRDSFIGVCATPSLNKSELCKCAKLVCAWYMAHVCAGLNYALNLFVCTISLVPTRNSFVCVTWLISPVLDLFVCATWHVHLAYDWIM